MTIGDLIKELSDLNQDKEVLIKTYSQMDGDVQHEPIYSISDYVNIDSNEEYYLLETS